VCAGRATITTYITALVNHDFRLEVVAEPAPDERLAAAQPRRAGLPSFLLARAAREPLLGGRK
jgi:hypothetical protein